MPSYKVVITMVVEAESKAEATQLVSPTEAQLVSLEYISVKEVAPEPKPEAKAGWGKSLVSQLTGKR